jgi:hypothetical protein
MSNSNERDEADRGNDSSPESDYRVGNKKPPRHSQFKPGVSGNRKGRPKGRLNLQTRVHQALRKSVVVNNHGRPTRMPVMDVITNRLVEASMKGDLKAIHFVMQSDQEATSVETAKQGEAEDISLPKNESLRLILGRMRDLIGEDE